MADVASKQQTTALFLCTIVTRTRKHTELTEKLKNLMGNLCCAREHSVQFFVQFFYTVKLYGLMYSSTTNKTQRYKMVFITINALHVSGGSSAHHQELKTVYTASGFLSSFFCFLPLS